MTEIQQSNSHRMGNEPVGNEPAGRSTRTWRLRNSDEAAVRSLTRERGLSPLLARLLVNRGHTDARAAEAHLRANPMALHDPFLLPGMQAAVERIERAIRDDETILVHGDYDVDGVTGTSLLMKLFELLGAKATWHIPNRLVDGYSFGEHSIARAAETGAKVVISVDNGTSAHAVIAALKERGVDTVVTDHHEAMAGPLPDATAIVNPKLPGSTYPWRELCGGAVAFKLAWGIVSKRSGGRANGALKSFLEEATAYVAIATVCDVVPLLDENRIFARFGLKALAQSRSPGLQALREIAGLGQRALTAEDVGFQIGPRINASGRLGSAEHAVELLLAKDEASARRLAVQLDTLNKKRREIEGGVLVEARAQAREYEDDPVLVLAGQGWHQGVVGIVAARLVEEFDRPAIVVGLDGELGRGSARSVEGFSVLEAMNGATDHFERHGGHAQAAGCEVAATAIEDVRRAVCAKASEMLSDAPRRAPELWVDLEQPFEDMTTHAMVDLDRLGPFGAQNDKPLFLSRKVFLAQEPRAVGAEKNHLLLRLRRGNHVMKAMAFGQGKRLGQLAVGRPIDVVYTPRWNTFRGETNLELELHDFRSG